MYGLSGGVPLLVSVEDSDSSPGSHPLIWWVIGGGALSVSKVPHTPKREGPAIRNGLWGPPFLCAGGLFVCAVAGGVFGLWLIVSWDRYVLLLNRGGVGIFRARFGCPGRCFRGVASLRGGGGGWWLPAAPVHLILGFLAWSACLGWGRECAPPLSLLLAGFGGSSAPELRDLLLGFGQLCPFAKWGGGGITCWSSPRRVPPWRAGGRCGVRRRRWRCGRCGGCGPVARRGRIQR